MIHRSSRMIAVAAILSATLLLPAHTDALAAPVLPEVKPPVPAAKVQIQAARILPVRKPPYYGPFGKDYEYLLEEADRIAFSRALTSAKNRRWKRAVELAKKVENPLAGDVIAWLYIRETGANTSFKARTEFIRQNSDWPQIDTIIRRAEESASDKSLSTTDLIHWFEEFTPRSGPGRATLARAYRENGEETKAAALARLAWLEGTFNRSQERAFLRSFDSLFDKDDHKARLERLLWDGHANGARRMLRRVDSGYRKLAEARIALMTSSYGVDAAIAKVPSALKTDPGLIYNRLKWRNKRRRYESAAELLPKSQNDATRPDLWWRERHLLAREALSEGAITDAYRIAADNKATDALSIFEAEWLAGWIQLQFLMDPEAALPHFYKVYDAVAFPVSLSRGAYWIGRAIEEGGDPELAKNWYQKAAVHITTYYGQLALAKLTGDTFPQLPLDPLPTISERSSFHQSRLAQVVRMLAEIGNKDHLRTFVLAAAKSSDFATERHLAAEMVSKFSRPDLGVWIARRAAQDHITLVEFGFPVPAYDYPNIPEKPLLLAITRQESNFDVAARSHAGARGLMQLMPATAKAVSRQIRERYDRDALTIDPTYNISLGSKYLGDLIDDFDGSYIMAIAGYNAGPHRVRRWIKEFGDPRKPDVDPIDWIEQIPFTETRNYVQRVMENLQVYRAVMLNTQQLAQTLPADLSRPDNQN
ncbi:MAG: lytic transglycosylase domain-containing protein [Rhodospirillaceae bacterium]|nr:lytic transglycosylase domain-containing protein [Rhodospirillaceae bacterium]MBT5567190.1 lytic transglycosylase domain-containing protein [Rhodospirillaceae bacterium]MBT6089403.1 lytic transglycosylase domain-containing protein [Rhodospirillaceae bacterium]